jgi:two-component system, NtrC family, response regulator AtoC
VAERPSIVVVDDDELMRWSVCEHLDQNGYVAHPAVNGQDGLARIAEVAPSAVLLDLDMPVLDGLGALQKLREAGNDVPVIVITANTSVDAAIKATRLGAAAWLAKPFDLREVTIAIDRVVKEERLKDEVAYLRDRTRIGYGDFIGKSPTLKEVFALLERLEHVDAPTVLITGESGTGKDVVARMIHARGPRKAAPFVEIDCTALPETLIESELFGHERGAFTDARATKRGLFEVAANGVVFLDEIGEMTLATQAKLLRALENRKFKRVGGLANLPLDAGVIAATNRNLPEAVKKGKFREDLYYRLNVIPVHLPSLRERRDDLAALVAHFLDRFSRQFGRRVGGLTAAAMRYLEAYPWPGNVRELRNVLERVVILGTDGTIDASDLPPEIRSAIITGPSPSMPPVGASPFHLPPEGVDLEGVEKSLLAQALDRTQGNQSAAARLLGISRYALRYRIEKFGLGVAPSTD